jgi:uncharacterized protein (DUF488 family)
MTVNGQVTVFTIGHSNHAPESFLGLLRLHGITAVADVRSQPHSRHNPQYNRETLQRYLKDNGVSYVFLGRELGARSDDVSCYDRGKVNYERLAQTPLFQAGLERVIVGRESHQIALMCAEKEPLACHRTLLVARALVQRGVEVSHIHADGSLETHDDALSRLLTLVRLPEADLFHSREEQVQRAYALQADAVAYVDEELRDAETLEEP